MQKKFIDFPKPRLFIHFLNRTYHSFHFFGAVGFFAGLSLGISLIVITGISIWPLLLCGLAGLAVLFGLTFAYKIITGREELVYYQHEIAILICCWILLKSINIPVLPYLDITLLGIGAFLTFGRWGCFSVGCCHGRPSKFGAIYSSAHGEAGFPKYYVGLKIFPIPLVESAWVSITVLLGTLAVLFQYPPGTALLIYTCLYGLARFFFEYFRGDPERPYWFDFSEAQWTTLALLVFSLCGAHKGYLPFYIWHLWTVVFLIGFMALFKVFEINNPLTRTRLLNPHHVKEIATIIKQDESKLNKRIILSDDTITVSQTSLGIKISGDQSINKLGEKFIHFTLSGSKGDHGRKIRLSLPTAHQLAKTLCNLNKQFDDYEILKGSTGFYHIIFQPK